MSSVALFHKCLRSVVDPAAIDAGEQSGQPSRAKKIFYSGALTLLLCIALVFAYHTFYQGEGAQQGPTVKSPISSSPSETDAVHLLAEKLSESDGATLRLIPSGKAQWRSTTDAALQTTVTKPFYMEETLVTNAQYVDFLNAIRSTLTVQDFVVSSQGVVFLLLGEIREGYTPIEYRNGKFTLNAPEDADKPVVRVSPDGAQAYAHYYGRELPGTAQWLAARQSGLLAPDSASVTSEWGYEQVNSTERFFAFEISSADNSDSFCPLVRQRWEAFPDVGFRTIRSHSVTGGER